MREWIKVWWHCLINFHCMVKSTYESGAKKHWCECGYNHNRTWKEEKAYWGIG